MKTSAETELTDQKNDVTKKQALELTEKFLRYFKKFWNSDIRNEERQAWIQMCIRRIWVKDRNIIRIESREDFKPLTRF